MKIFSLSKDGGLKSRVWGYFLIEAKKAFSIVVLHFKDGGREAYHTHAFHAISWVLWGRLEEEVITAEDYHSLSVVTKTYRPSIFPIFTSRHRFHKVNSKKNSWVISFRGPWGKYWYEVVPDKDGGRTKYTLTEGRKVVADEKSTVLPED